ncbi:MAG TPA: hypothetical protein VI704_02170 [Bacteroidota bacterium]|nr:hypothetical protein [Bacteroidota bacterium]
MKMPHLKELILPIVIFLAGCTTYSNVEKVKDLNGVDGKTLIVRCRNMEVYHLNHASVNEHSITGSGRKFDRDKNTWTHFTGSISLGEVSSAAVEKVDVELTIQCFFALAFHVCAVVVLYIFFGLSSEKPNVVNYIHRRIT